MHLGEIFHLLNWVNEAFSGAIDENSNWRRTISQSTVLIFNCASGIFFQASGNHHWIEHSSYSLHEGQAGKPSPYL